MAAANVRGDEPVVAAQAEENPQASRVNQLRAQVDDVREIMTANVERVLARGERLEDLIEKSADLEAGSSGFRATARRVERHMWWKNAKCNCIIALMVLAIIAVIVIVVLYETGAFKPGSGGGKTVVTTTHPTAVYASTAATQ